MNEIDAGAQGRPDQPEETLENIGQEIDPVFQFADQGVLVEDAEQAQVAGHGNSYQLPHRLHEVDAALPFGNPAALLRLPKTDLKPGDAIHADRAVQHGK